MFFTASTTAHKLPLFWIRSIQPMPILPIFWRSLLILSSYLRLGLPIVLCPSGFLIKTLYAPFLFPVRVTFPYKGVPRRKKWTTIWWNLYLISDKLKLNKRQRRKIWCSQSVADEQHNFVEYYTVSIGGWVPTVQETCRLYGHRQAGRNLLLF